MTEPFGGEGTEDGERGRRHSPECAVDEATTASEPTRRTPASGTRTFGQPLPHHRERHGDEDGARTGGTQREGDDHLADRRLAAPNP